MKTVKIELNESEIDTLLIGLDQACDNTADDEDYGYFQDLIKKIIEARKQLKKVAA